MDSSSVNPSSLSLNASARARIGIFGGGQLGRMLVYAAQRMAHQTIVFDPDPHSPAGHIADQHIQADYSDPEQLTRFAKMCDVITTEFENIPVAAFECVQKLTPTSPDARALQIAQDRVVEKSFLADIGVAVVPFVALSDGDDVAHALQQMQFPVLLKTARLGYDGKGQVLANNVQEVQEAMSQLAAQDYVAEQAIDLQAELSVVLARSADQQTVLYPSALNAHRNGILHTSTVPCGLDPKIVQQVEALATQIADAMNYCGVLAVEFFLDSEDQVFVNELAPRPHNSGHYTIDACATSQFEQQLRMACGIAAGDTRLLTPVTMVNLLGDLWAKGEPDWNVLWKHPNVKLHLYGKKEPRPGRKMGHFCVLDTSADAAHSLADTLYQILHTQSQ